jgi:hypothetical protein
MAETRRVYLASLENPPVALADASPPGIDPTTTAAYATAQSVNETIAYAP